MQEELDKARHTNYCSTDTNGEFFGWTDPQVCSVPQRGEEELVHSMGVPATLCSGNRGVGGYAKVHATCCELNSKSPSQST